jgi:hypothetical protein
VAPYHPRWRDTTPLNRREREQQQWFVPFMCPALLMRDALSRSCCCKQTPRHKRALRCAALVVRGRRRDLAWNEPAGLLVNPGACSHRCRCCSLALAFSSEKGDGAMFRADRRRLAERNHARTHDADGGRTACVAYRICRYLVALCVLKRWFLQTGREDDTPRASAG